MYTNGYYLLTAAAISVDAFAVGIAYGVKGIRFTAAGYAAFASVCFAVLMLGVSAGRLLCVLSIGKKMGAALILCAGAVMLLQQAGVIKDVPLIGLIASPEKSDKNKNRKIEGKEAALIALALSLDGCIVSAANAAAANSLVLPAAVFAFHCLLLRVGMLAGGKIAADGCERVCGITAGLLLLALGIDGVIN